MDATSWQRGALMKKIPAEHFYKCRGYYLHHKLGDYTTEKAKKQRLGKTDRGTWAALHSSVRQDNFATILRYFGEIQKDYGVFTLDYYIFPFPSPPGDTFTGCHAT